MGRHWLIGAIAMAVLLAAAVTLVVTRTPPRPTFPGQSQAPGAGSATAKGTVTVPPPLPGEPSIGADREAMLAKFAANISQGFYTPSNLLFLLCNSEAGRAAANQGGEPMTMALMRRMVLLFRSAPGMAQVACPATPPQTP